MKTLVLFLLGSSAAYASEPYTASTLDYNKPTNISLGWHTAKANNCGWFQASTGDQWFFILPNGTATVIVASNNPYVAMGIGPTCANGFGIQWHVIDTDTGAFDQMYGLDN